MVTAEQANGNHAIAVRDTASIMERAVIQGDLSELTPEERVDYYRRVCESLSLNPYTKPFEYLSLDAPGGGKKLVLYARKDCTDQLRDIKKVSITKLEHARTPDLYIVTAHAVLPDGRTDSAVGAVSIAKENGQWKSTQANPPKRYFEGNGTFSPLSGDALANAIMKAETKAKRRVTLSICGLGMTDESEVDSIPGAVLVQTDFPSATEVDSPVEDDADVEAALADWVVAAKEADALKIEHKELPALSSASKIRRWTAALKDKLEQTRAQVGTPTEAEKAAPRDTATGEVLEDGDETPWQRNRRLVKRAQELHLTGIPTLNTRSGEDVITQANAELAARIENYELDQQLIEEEPS